MQIEARQGDITRLDVDAIVNAANNQLARGAGVCGAIFAAAGRQLDGACDAIGWCETGEAVWTPGFDLPARWVIHTVGPIWHGGRSDEARDLASCYRRSLEVADDLGARTIAFPAISTGIYGYPATDAAEIAVRTVQSTETTNVERVILCAFDEGTHELYRTLLNP